MILRLVLPIKYDILILDWIAIILVVKIRIVGYILSKLWAPKVTKVYTKIMGCNAKKGEDLGA